MTERYAYLDSWENLEPDMFKAVFTYALDIAKKEGKDLTLVVNNVSQCSDFVSKFIDQKDVNKLKKGDAASYNGVNISLKSPFSIKDYQHYGVFCSFHPSDKALASMENSKEPKAIVILGEQEKHLQEWINLNKAKSLAKS